MIEIFIATFIALFVIVDPLGSASVFAAITKNVSKAEARKIAISGVLIATSILVIFAFVGEALLHHLGISLPAFRVAGGTLLFVTAFQMIMGANGADQFAEGVTSGKQSVSSLAVFPVAIPLLAGPGCMTAVVLHASEASNMLGAMIVAAAIVAVQCIALITMMMSVKLVSLIGHTGSSIAARIVGVLLAALSVQFVADGIRGLIAG